MGQKSDRGDVVKNWDMGSVWGGIFFWRNALRGNEVKKCHCDFQEDMTEAGNDFGASGTAPVMQKYVSERKIRRWFCIL